MYIDSGCPVFYITSKTCDLAGENNKILTEWKWFETTVLLINFNRLTRIFLPYISNTLPIQAKIVGSYNSTQNSTSIFYSIVRLVLWCLTPLSTIVQLYRGSKFHFYITISYSIFNSRKWVDTSAGGLLVPEGIIHPAVSASPLTWFIRYIFIEIYSF